MAAVILGRNIRKQPEKQYAEKQSRIMHFFFQAGLVFPAALSLVYPGLRKFDVLIGFPSIQGISSLTVGIIVFSIGLYFIINAIMGLGKQGNGAPGFKLTDKVAHKGVYRMLRNPMSLGHYMFYLGISLMAGSTYLTLGTLFFIIPAHIFHLKYFEELELEIRYGKEYMEYKKSLPFIIPRFRTLNKVNV